jgi:hypothetical protein
MGRVASPASDEDAGWSGDVCNGGEWGGGVKGASDGAFGEADEDWSLNVSEGPRSDDDLLSSRILREVDSPSNMPIQHSLNSEALNKSVSVEYNTSERTVLVDVLLFFTADDGLFRSQDW